MYMQFIEQWEENFPDHPEGPTYDDFQDWLYDKADLALGDM